MSNKQLITEILTTFGKSLKGDIQDGTKARFKELVEFEPVEKLRQRLNTIKRASDELDDDDNKDILMGVVLLSSDANKTFNFQTMKDQMNNIMSSCKETESYGAKIGDCISSNITRLGGRRKSRKSRRRRHSRRRHSKRRHSRRSHN